jgi:rare lipoprotein A
MQFDWLRASLGRRSAARARALNVLATGSAVLGATFVSAVAVDAKGPGQTYCFYKTCHRVKTIAETEALVGRDMKVIASHYDSCKKDRFNPCGLTSSGERFNAESPDNAASPILPDGTIALVWSKTTREAVVLRINNAGPYWGNRKLDLSRGAARKLGIHGVGEVTLRVLKAPTPAEARYSKNRVYEPVPGPIGQFASLDAAQGAMSIMVAEGRPKTVALAGLAAPAAVDPAVSIAAAFKAPLVPGFAIPKGALAEALIAQSATERRVVTADVPPASPIRASEQASIDVMVVAPKLRAAAPVTPRLTRVKAVDVSAAPADAAPPSPTPARNAVAVAKPRVAPAKPARVAAKTERKAKPVRVVAAKPKAAPATVVAARPEPTREIHVGFTTYAEARYRTKPKVASVGGKRKSMKPAAQSAPDVMATVPSAPNQTKRAGLPRNGKSAALKKGGGWQSSAVFDPVPALGGPLMTGQHPKVPAGGLRDESEMPRRPGRRVPASSLV